MATIAIGLVAVSFASGGFFPTEFAAIAIAAWLMVGLLAVASTEPPAQPTRAALWVAAAGLALVGWTALSLAWASDRGTGYEDVVRMLGYVGGFLALSLWSRSSRPGWLEGALVGGGAVLVCAVGSRVLGLAGDELAGQLPSSTGRLSFPIGYWNALGLLAAAVGTLGVWASGSRPGPTARVGVALLPTVGLTILLTDSRAASLAVVVGVGVAAYFSVDRRLALGAVLVASVSSVPLLVGAILVEGFRRGQLDALAIEALLLAAPLVAATAATAFFSHRVARLFPHWRVRLGRIEAAALAVVLVGAVLVFGSGGLGSISGEAAIDAGPESAGQSSIFSGGGRREFWSAGIDAFAAAPLEGIGAGGFENWWNANGGLQVSVQNAHSAQVETLAEVGVVGFSLLMLIGLVVVGSAVVRLRVASGEERAILGVALALILVVGIGASIDWIFEVPAVFGVGVVAAAIVCGSRPGGGPWEVLGGFGRVSLATVAVGAVLASGALAVGAMQLQRSRDALEVADVVEAAGAARAAAAFLPASSEPQLLLAQAEQLAGNLEAATHNAAESARKNPEDYRPWLILAEIQAVTGDLDAAFAYAARGSALALAVLPRATLEQRTRPR